MASFNLDGVHNWTSHGTTLNGTTSNEAREHTNFNEVHLAEATTEGGGILTYDDQGNLLKRVLPGGASYSYHWDALNRLRKVTETGTGDEVVGYLHTTGNQRVSRTISEVGESSYPTIIGTTHFYYAGWRLCDEYSANPGESLKYQYVWGPRYADELLCRDDRSDNTTIAQLNDNVAGGAPGGTSGGRQYQHVDRTWNIRAVTDEAGTVLERYLYDPFGHPFVFNPAGTVPLTGTTIDQAYGFTSQRYDRETGLWYFKHRYLDDGLGRFISRDPAGYVDGMNLYTAYFVLTGTDPLGLQSQIDRFMKHAVDDPDITPGNVSDGYNEASKRDIDNVKDAELQKKYRLAQEKMNATDVARDKQTRATRSTTSNKVKLLGDAVSAITFSIHLDNAIADPSLKNIMNAAWSGGGIAVSTAADLGKASAKKLILPIALVDGVMNVWQIGEDLITAGQEVNEITVSLGDAFHNNTNINSSIKDRVYGGGNANGGASTDEFNDYVEGLAEKGGRIIR